MVAAALGDRLVVGQELELAVEAGDLLEVADQAPVDVDHRRRLRERQAHRLRLRVAAVQHPLGDRVGHLDEQLVALLLGQVAGGDDAVEQDLDVHLVVRAVDAGDVVDRVGVDAAAGERVLDPAPLGEAEVAALADDAAAQLRAVERARRRWPCRRRRRGSRSTPSRRCRCRRSRAGRRARAGSRGSARSARQLVGLDPERVRACGEIGIDFALRG